MTSLEQHGEERCVAPVPPEREPVQAPVPAPRRDPL
eukprot:CAMPEP_0182899002 /NCGR_PEP_ID=MMETSP0034_2-20130328/27827_1 /TAXON_ID=156128 /ORGANISM="Nephroselmis pyriformis, Strain CCMP717" /LENGTH=35 /DNA_ID= /DNA_START= /DNA_END= /DNA_ORIENTATION=